MKKLYRALVVVMFLICSGSAALAEGKPGDTDEHLYSHKVAAESQYADVKKHQCCPHCGMDREKFNYSRMLITYSDGFTVGVCSVHCAVTALKNYKNRPVASVEVADYNTKKLLNVEKAFWVIGGSKRGVMTIYAKWAFEKKEDATAFIKKNHGKLITYKEVLVYTEKSQ
ncbi:MAG: nitrous oxide reductase accessory protein NosL [Desulfuromonadaceae bacterium]